MNIHVETPRPSARSLSLPKMVTAALSCPDITCFPGPESRKFIGLRLIRVCPARARAGALSRRGARATRAASDEARPLMALGKFPNAIKGLASSDAARVARAPLLLSAPARARAGQTRIRRKPMNFLDSGPGKQVISGQLRAAVTIFGSDS